MSSLRIREFFVLGLLLLVFTPVVSGGYVPYREEYGIYKLDIETGETQLVYSSPQEITNIDLSPDGTKFALCMYHGDGYEYSEIYTMNIDSTGLTRLTDNTGWDLYPNWSPDGSEFVFLSWRDSSLDIYKMNSDGSNQRLLYDSGGHDADLDWVGDHIVFTRDSQIWMMNSDGSDVHQLTDPPNAGVWGDSVLPFGDYDPRISPDGSLVVFERLVDDMTEHGNYELFIIGIDGEGEHNITGTGWTQGIAQWSSTGEELIYLVSAMGEEGRYDIFKINVDGSGVTDLTSEHYPPGFIAHHPIYAGDDSNVYFVGQWWNWAVLDSTLTCSLSKSTATLGDFIIISSEVQPEIHGIEAKITITEPESSKTIDTVIFEDGTYQLTYIPEKVGEYSVQVEWEGDLGHHGSTSAAVGFTVEERLPSDEGIPGYPVTALLLGLAMYLVSRRHSYQRKK
ncbi:MAG: hypothetical protein NWF07_09465 [Candidatus Bathyarchaeota archaeon]|nr:hypothetical protein [Candidatus Bathyarchaeota archaeon]